MTSIRDVAVPLTLSLAALCTACAHGHGHGGGHGPGHGRGFPSMLSVSGSGEVSAAPDVARTNVGVETRAVEAKDATRLANERMGRVIAALKQAGVAAEDLRTHNLSLRFERSPNPPVSVRELPVRVQGEPSPGGGATTTAVKPAAAKAKPEGFYVARNMVEVTVRDLDAVSDVLSAATDAGADQLWGIQFEVEDTQPLIAQAREKAVKQAEETAKQLASLTHVELGTVVSVTDGAAPQGPPMPMMAMRASAESGAANSVPVERGQLTVTHEVSVVYRLKGD